MCIGVMETKGSIIGGIIVYIYVCIGVMETKGSII